MINSFNISHSYKNNWDTTAIINVCGELKYLEIASWFMQHAETLDIEGSFCVEDPQDLLNLLTWTVKSNSLLTNSSKGEILRTATAYNGGDMPEWHLAVEYFLAFELGIDPADVPAWVLEIV